MLDLVTTTQFKKDLKRIRKRGYDLSKLDDMILSILVDTLNSYKEDSYAAIGRAA